MNIINYLKTKKKNKHTPKNIYIIKPGEVTNRGTGISIENDISSI